VRLLGKSDEQGYVMSSNYSEDVEMQDVQGEDDEEGEVDVELDADRGELVLSDLYYMLKTKLQRQVTLKTRR
jgi:hypothetical protein